MKKFIPAIASLLLTSCFIHQRPHTNFRLARKPFTIKHPTDLRTDGVYIRTDTLRTTTKYYYHFLRFFEDGTLYTGFKYDLPIDTNFLKQVSPDAGQWGAYRNDSNSIHYEFFSDNIYEKRWALIKDNCYWEGERLHHSPIDRFYAPDTVSIRSDARPYTFLPLTLNPEDSKQMPLAKLRKKRQQRK